MTKPFILFQGPVATRSGYGAHARDLVESFMDSDKYDITSNSIYFDRLKNHPAWETKNFCAWDVSIDGARELNTYLKANNDIYYF